MKANYDVLVDGEDFAALLDAGFDEEFIQVSPEEFGVNCRLVGVQKGPIAGFVDLRAIERKARKCGIKDYQIRPADVVFADVDGAVRPETSTAGAICAALQEILDQHMGG